MYDNIITLGNEFMLSLCDLISEESRLVGNCDQDIIGYRTLPNAEV